MYDFIPFIVLNLSGAGDGKVTEVFARYFTNVYVTEMSPVMRRQLSKRGFRSVFFIF